MAPPTINSRGRSVRFPGSVDLALSWHEVNPDLMRKILWDNAVKAFGDP